MSEDRSAESQPNSDSASRAADQAPVDPKELLACLRKIGKGLIASGVSVGVVENTLTEVALIYGVMAEVLALPNYVMIELGGAERGHVEFAVQRLTSLQLDQISAFTEAVDLVMRKQISLVEASQQIDGILARPPRFYPAAWIIGYFLSCVGLTMLYRPDVRAIAVTGLAGVLVGLIVVAFRRAPRFDLLLPVFAAIAVSMLIFGLTRMGVIFGPANLLITPLVTFLPGSILTTGIIELASKHILSGSARLIYGATVLVLLFIGIAIGFNLTGATESQVFAFEMTPFGWWLPLLGTTLFGIGTFIRLSGANRDLFWMLLVLYIAMIGKTLGESYFHIYAGAFIGAVLMAVSSELIARSPRRTPAVVSQSLAFWFLVPGSLGLLSVTSLLRNDLQSTAIGLGQTLFLMVTIALGVLLGTLTVSPSKFVTTDQANRS